MNMMNVGKLLGKVNLYVVHKVSEAVVVENENEILYLCQGPAESGEGSGVEVGVEGSVEMQQEVEEGSLDCGRDLERDDGVQIDTEAIKSPISLPTTTKSRFHPRFNSVNRKEKVKY
ncbi:hypothetical protein LR48_Vigan04g056800 [Vigna angularis]|uniref:Uncharacterized protein n=1 Tax=Phaseolus angularis TaxID=3914 RepID=A0A0L9UBP7_PHAAN|nr:hypothetical protein LR48_Vigan04g056800 [Vigna angularis]